MTILNYQSPFTGQEIDVYLAKAATALQADTGVLLSSVDDTPVNGATTAPISSNWAYDHAAATQAHGISSFGATLVNDADAATARSTLGLGEAATKAVGTTSDTVAAGDTLATETDNRVLYDEELVRAVTYATDLAGQAARTLSGSLPNNVPASASAPGVAGQMRYASGFLYVCVAANTWQRVAIATWS